MRNLDADGDVVAFLVLVNANIAGANLETVGCDMGIDLSGIAGEDIDVAVVGIDVQIGVAADFIAFRPFVGAQRVEPRLPTKFLPPESPPSSRLFDSFVSLRRALRSSAALCSVAV